MAHGFLDELDITTEGPETKIVILNTQLRYQSQDGRVFTIPAGFRCDLASVPAIFRAIAPPWQQSARSGVMHDCGYRWYEVWGTAKTDLDSLFYESLRSDGTSGWRARLMQAAVVVGGKLAWNRWRGTPSGQKGIPPPPVQMP
jgi:hypothetical protein